MLTWQVKQTVNDRHTIHRVINSFALFSVWEYNLCWHLKLLNSTRSLHVLSSRKKTVIHIDKDSFHVNWRKKNQKEWTTLKPAMIYTIADPAD